MTYDCEANHIVTQDSRVWIAGLSDEGGAGSWLAFAMKEYVEPRLDEVAKLNTGTYAANHPDFGWICFGGNISVSGDEVTVKPKDASRTRFYLAPGALWLTLDSGQFERLVWMRKLENCESHLRRRTDSHLRCASGSSNRRIFPEWVPFT
jgi:hypothetical protein